MTRIRQNGVLIIEAEPQGTCQLCGENAETRPYGPGGKEVCFNCGMKDEPEAHRRFLSILNGERRGRLQ